MTKTVRFVALLLMAVLAAVSAMAQTPADEKPAGDTSPALELGRAYTKDFYRGELNRLYAKFSPQFQESMTIEELRTFRHNVSSQFGVEREVISEKIIPKGAFLIYVRRSRFAKYDGAVELIVALRGSNLIAGMTMKPVEDDG